MDTNTLTVNNALLGLPICKSKYAIRDAKTRRYFTMNQQWRHENPRLFSNAGTARRHLDVLTKAIPELSGEVIEVRLVPMRGSEVLA